MIKLSPKQELFCRLYSSNREFFGNGVVSYIKAFDIDTNKRGQYNVAKSGASELLAKPYILERINKLMDIYVNNETVDKELSFVILQHADFRSKVSAIKEWNKLKSRVEEKMTHKIENTLSDEQIDQLLKRRKDAETEKTQGDVGVQDSEPSEPSVEPQEFSDEV